MLLATVRAFAERRLGRPLSAGEQHVDLIKLDHDLEQGKARLAAAIEKEKRRAIRALVENDAEPRLRVTEEMARALLALYNAGRRHAAAEMKSMGLRPVRALALEDPHIDPFLARLRTILHPINVRILDEAAGIVAEAGDLGASAVIRELDRRVPGALNAASQMTSGTLYAGLGDTFEANSHLFPGFQYSAVMDAATCEVCAPMDGTEYATWDEAMVDLPNGGPNPECLGGGRCRCRIVPIPDPTRL